jgi:hypothetical protein
MSVQRGMHSSPHEQVARIADWYGAQLTTRAGGGHCWLIWCTAHHTGGWRTLLTDMVHSSPHGRVASIADWYGAYLSTQAGGVHCWLIWCIAHHTGGWRALLTDMVHSSPHGRVARITDWYGPVNSVRWTDSLPIIPFLSQSTQVLIAKAHFRCQTCNCKSNSISTFHFYALKVRFLDIILCQFLVYATWVIGLYAAGPDFFHVTTVSLVNYNNKPLCYSVDSFPQFLMDLSPCRTNISLLSFLALCYFYSNIMSHNHIKWQTLLSSV